MHNHLECGAGSGSAAKQQHISSGSAREPRTGSPTTENYIPRGNGVGSVWTGRKQLYVRIDAVFFEQSLIDGDEVRGIRRVCARSKVDFYELRSVCRAGLSLCGGEADASRDEK